MLFKKIKNVDHLDIILIKLGMVFLTIFLLKVFSNFMNWANNVNIWVVLLLMVLLFARPCYRHCMCQKTPQ